MTLTDADLFCATCHAYVHVFLERCPACGAARGSRVADAEADPDIGLARLADDPVLRRKLTHLLDGYALTAPRLSLPRKTGFEGSGGGDYTIAEATGLLAGLLVLRGFGCPPRPDQPVDVRLALTGDALELHAAAGSRRIGVPLAGILSIAAPPSGGLPGWAGISAGGGETLRRPLIPVGSLLVTYAVDRSPDQVSVQNRPGMFNTKARADYYGNLRRWLGITAAEAAERRWMAIGLRRYLAEIGLGPAVAAETGAGAAAEAAAVPTETPTAIAAAARPSARAALEELGELRAAGLVDEDEYRRKRAEILDRL